MRKTWIFVFLTIFIFTISLLLRLPAYAQLKSDIFEKIETNIINKKWNAVQPLIYSLPETNAEEERFNGDYEYSVKKIIEYLEEYDFFKKKLESDPSNIKSYFTILNNHYKAIPAKLYFSQKFIDKVINTPLKTARNRTNEIVKKIEKEKKLKIKKFEPEEIYVYVKAKTGNLRTEPKGNKIAEISQGTKVKLLRKKENWIKVQVTGWIWKASTTSDRSEITKLRTKQNKAGVKIAGGFIYKNIRFKNSSQGRVDVIGEMINYSGKTYKTAYFILSIYDENKTLISTEYISIYNFMKGQKKSFNTTIESEQKSIKTYKIDFDDGL